MAPHSILWSWARAITIPYATKCQVFGYLYGPLLPAPVAMVVSDLPSASLGG
jgi:hypothetical protein